MLNQAEQQVFGTIAAASGGAQGQTVGHDSAQGASQGGQEAGTTNGDTYLPGELAASEGLDGGFVLEDGSKGTTGEQGSQGGEAK